MKKVHKTHDYNDNSNQKPPIKPKNFHAHAVPHCINQHAQRNKYRYSCYSAYQLSNVAFNTCPM